MQDADGYEELARDLMGELMAIGRVVKPVVVNSVRGETAVLVSLFRAGGDLTPRELGERTHVTSARVANILHALEDKGLVARHPSTTDRRRVEVELTELGRTETERLLGERMGAVERYLRALGADDARELVRLARRSRDLLDGRLARDGEHA